MFSNWEDQLNAQLYEEYARQFPSSYAFMHIPVMTAFPLKGLNYPTRVEILEKAYQRLDKTYRASAQWCYYVVEKDRDVN